MVYQSGIVYCHLTLLNWVNGPILILSHNVHILIIVTVVVNTLSSMLNVLLLKVKQMSTNVYMFNICLNLNSSQSHGLSHKERDQVEVKVPAHMYMNVT